ncbi:MAG TPA: futalosine hydrolase [Bacteroidetes bacterium]|jgi:futalosine hydrolase|nr:MAG: hypothetical protein ABR95_07055 [Sphingobacteriales bacterium BACL12 MAG-120813-bin55]HCK22655.1 futalosine hydrolase [Bacteroidota bacterium]
MRILLVSATQEEIPGWFKGTATQSRKSSFSGLTIDVLVTGPGINHTAFWLGRRLAGSAYDLVINAGIAGSFNNSLPSGTVTQVTTDRFADFGYTSPEGFTDASAAGLLSPAGDWLSADGWITSTQHEGLTSLQQLSEVRGITVQTVTGDARTIEQMRERYHPDIETMEGAAFLYACHQSGMPALCIRAISNWVEPRNKANWNIPLAVQELNATLNAILNELNQSV